MSAHDRGAFGQLLAEAASLGLHGLTFRVDLLAPDDDEDRWTAADDDGTKVGSGRTGEEAFRRLLEKVRGSSEIS